MNRRLFFVLPMLVSIGWLLAGCSSTKPSLVSYDPKKPHIHLPGAEVDQAKSVAMGSAGAKGWKVVESADNRLVVKRPLDAATARSFTGKPVSSAFIEVRSDFHERQDGVNVVVSATMIADQGSKTERKIDVTERYRDHLNNSLSSLRRTWDENRWRVASSTPPVHPKVTSSESGVATGTESAESRTQVASSGTKATADEDFSRMATTTSIPDPAPSPFPAAAAAATAVPIEDRSGGPSPDTAASGPVPSYPPNDMLALDSNTQAGVWSYYAEHYAKIRGCALSEQGAVLQQMQQEHEVYRVNCEDKKSFIVKCNAGTCRGME